MQYKTLSQEFSLSYSSHPFISKDALIRTTMQACSQVGTGYLDHKATHKPQCSPRHAVLEVGHCLPGDISKFLLDATALIQRKNQTEMTWTSALHSMDLICSVTQAWINSTDLSHKTYIPTLQTSAFWIKSTNLIQQVLASKSYHHLQPPINFLVFFRKTRTSTWLHVHTTITSFP